VAQAHSRRLGAGGHLGVEGVAHPFDGGVEHRDVDGGAVAGAATSQQRGEGGLRGVHAAAMSEVGMPVLTAVSGVPVIEMRPAFGLDQHVVGFALFQRAAPAESRHVDDDQFASCRTEFVSTNPETFDGAGCEVLQEDISAVDQAPDNLAALRAFEVIVVLCNPVNFNEPYREVMTLTVAAAYSDEDGRSRKEKVGIYGPDL
jgi:hypothetical protein